MDACNSRDSTFFSGQMYENDLYYNIYYFQFCPQLKYKKKLLGGVDEYTLEQKYAKLWWLVIVVTCKSSVCLYL